jgi:hypothetical protein
VQSYRSHVTLEAELAIDLNWTTVLPLKLWSSVRDGSAVGACIYTMGGRQPTFRSVSAAVLQLVVPSKEVAKVEDARRLAWSTHREPPNFLSIQTHQNRLLRHAATSTTLFCCQY